MIEKTFSNDSSNNNYHYGTVSTPTQNSSGNKRSGAKATRYQSFYDQSFKISNALKVSSTESVNIVRTTSNDSGSIQLPKEVRILGHSSSLPSLKTVLNKRSNQKLRFNEIRISSVASNNSTNSTVGSSGQARKLSPPIQVKNKVSNNSHPNLNMVPNNTPPKTIGPLPIITKHDSNSPISVNSEVSSTIISSNATIQTEHSSLHDQQTGSFASKDSEQHTIVDIPTPQIVISTEEDKSILTPISNNDDNNNNSNYNNEDQDQNINNMSLTSNEVLSIIAGSIVSGANTGPKNTSPSKTAPTSAVSPISASFPTGSTTPTKTKPSSNSTNLTRTSIKPPSTSSSYITTKHSSNRRPLSPQQESFLKQTQIPSFKVNLHTETSQKNGTLQAGSQSLPENKRNVQVQPLQTQNKHYQHRKSKSMSLSTGQENENDDLSSLRLSGSKRNSRFINWLKRK